MTTQSPPSESPGPLRDPLCSESWDEQGFVLTVTRKPGVLLVLWPICAAFALYELYQIVVVHRGRIFFDFGVTMFAFCMFAFGVAILPKRQSKVVMSIRRDGVSVCYIPRGIFDRNFFVPLADVTGFATRERGAGAGSRWPVLCTAKGEKAMGMTAGDIGRVRVADLVERLNYVLARVPLGPPYR